MVTIFAAFGPTSKETAIVYLAGVVAFALAAFAAPVSKRFAGGPVGLIALGLGLWLWPTMWNTADAAL